MSEGVWDYWQSTPDGIRSFIIAALSAWFGAWLNGRAVKRRLIIDELRSLDAANALCFSIASNYIAIKHQYINEINLIYKKLINDYYDHMNKCIIFNLKSDFHFDMDLTVIPAIKFPIEYLEKIVCEKVSIGGEGVATVVALSVAIADLNTSINLQNELCSEFRQTSQNSSEKKSKYLGIFFEDKCDSRFRNNIEALVHRTDDCIYFSKHLSSLIVRIVNKIRSRNLLFFLSGQKLNEIDWKIAEEAGLMPDATEYSNWHRGFVKRPSIFSRVKLWLNKSLGKFNFFV
jgi:hypothetical protein